MRINQLIALKDQSGKRRRIIIFTVLTIALLTVLYFWSSSNDEEKSAKDVKKKYVSVAPTPEQFKSPASLVTERALVKDDKKLVDDNPPVDDTPPVDDKKPVVDTRSFPQMETLFHKAEAAYAKEEYGKTREYCYQILDSRKVPDANPLWLKIVKLLGDANTKIFFPIIRFRRKR